MPRSLPPKLQSPLTGSSATAILPTAWLPPYLSVTEVLDSCSAALKEALPTEVWVKGEVLGYKGPKTGHRYFDLVEHGRDKAVLPAAIWKSSWASIERRLTAAGMQLCDGQEMLLRGRIRLYRGAGKLTFSVSDVLPEFTLGKLELTRRAVLERLEKEGLFGVNKRHKLAAIPLRIGLISSQGAAGMQDFLSVLRQSGYAFEVFFISVPVQGCEMEGAVCRALAMISEGHQRLNLDVLTIVRGGGSPLDLGWWNSYAIGVAVAQMPLPVICGIGHDQDRVAIDEVAHTRSPTPTAAAQFIVSTIRAAEESLTTAQRTLAHCAKRLVSEQASCLIERSITPARKCPAATRECLGY